MNGPLISFSWFQLGLGFLLAVIIAVGAYAARSLSRSGAVAAALLGTAIFGLGGLPWAALLLTFFLSSSALSRLFKRRKAALDEKYAKGSRRDAGQVLANGGIAGLLVLVQAALPNVSWPWLAAAAALAAANADTWATELGVLSRSAPRLITTGKKVEMGSSGGVTPLGTLAALGGALAVGLAALLFWPGGAADASPAAWGIRLGVIALAGVAGSLVDSWLGASIQAIYHCPVCNKETERHPLHTCGAQTSLARGLAWLDNDWVNTACTLSAAALGVAAAFTLGGTMNANSTPSAAIPATPGFHLSGPAFADGQSIPAQYTCSGEDLSPALAWEGAPAGTQSFALVMDDPDAPMGTFVHWVVYNLPPERTGLPEAVSAGEPIAQGRTSFNRRAYGGPCPPPGPAHRYFFTLYALDLAPSLPDGLDKAGLMKIIDGYILGRAVWMGTFRR